MTLLEVNSLSKSYKDKTALNGVSFAIGKGEKVALLGSNGAGKSTLINICAGLKRHDHGSVKIFGKEHLSLKSKSRFSVLPQTLDFPKDLKVKEIINVVASHYNTNQSDNYISNLKIGGLLNKFSNQLSGGEERRISFLLSFLGSPDLCLLDEPTANIDIENRVLIYNFLEQFYQNREKSLIFSSHQMDEVERVAERIIVMHNGDVVLDDTVESIKGSLKLKKIEFNCDDELTMEHKPSKISRDGSHYMILTDNTDHMIKELAQNNIDFKNLTITKPSLEEIILRLWK